MEKLSETGKKELLRLLKMYKVDIEYIKEKLEKLEQMV